MPGTSDAYCLIDNENSRTYACVCIRIRIYMALIGESCGIRSRRPTLYIALEIIKLLPGPFLYLYIGAQISVAK